LLALNHVWRLHRPRVALHSLAAQLGSDVPFFLEGPTAYAYGRGEELSRVTSPPSLTGILVNPGFGVSASWAYGQFSGQSSATDLMLPNLLQALANRDLARIGEFMVNDLQAGVAKAYPVICQAQAALRTVGASVTFMSGSGPTIVGIFSPAVDLSSAVASLCRHSGWTVIPFTTRSESPHPELRC
jgi:4-diphosphocytidyl-2-C-methyl-D-erythritol kinase